MLLFFCLVMRLALRCMFTYIPPTSILSCPLLTKPLAHNLLGLKQEFALKQYNKATRFLRFVLGRCFNAGTFCTEDDSVELVNTMRISCWTKSRCALKGIG
ncbi:hypothetical protein EDB80DRAFT_744165 [Ilyonectria destructans]|nr:hypothetical protein EDB80DRAFT_744165 [Ilyonectria destructans]